MVEPPCGEKELREESSSPSLAASAWDYFTATMPHFSVEHLEFTNSITWKPKSYLVYVKFINPSEMSYPTPHIGRSTRTSAYIRSSFKAQVHGGPDALFFQLFATLGAACLYQRNCLAARATPRTWSEPGKLYFTLVHSFLQASVSHSGFKNTSRNPTCIAFYAGFSQYILSSSLPLQREA